jgi:uncharacterized membrane protein
MKRLYFLVPDIDNATRIVTALKEMGIVDEGMHVIVKDLEKQQKLEMTQILEAGVLETTDLLNALVRGTIAGGIVGLVAGIILVKFPPQEFVLGIGTVIGLILFGMIFGAWSSSLVGISIPNATVQKFERAVEAGGIMMLVDVPKMKEEEIMHFMKTYHPETTVHGLQLGNNPMQKLG